ncbi:MAG: hypothetical protein ACRC0F_10135 [Cetobacterium sp.]
MGFFSSVCSWVSNAVSNTVSNVVDWISDKVSSAVDWVKEVLGLGETPEYDPNNSSIDETKKINELLEKCIDEYGKEAKKYDVLAINIINEHLSGIEKELRSFNSEEKIIEEHIFEMFKYQTQDIKNKLKNIYSKHISDVFSLNNSKLLDILRLSPGEIKENKIKNLAICTIEEANSKLIEQLETFVNEQQNFIEKRLSEFTNNLELTLAKEVENTGNIMTSLKEGEQKIEEEKNRYRILLPKLQKLLI